MSNSPANPDSYHSVQEPVTVAAADIDFLGSKLASTARGRVRLCAHGSPEDAIQEMFIVLAKDTYVRPHRHPGTVESFHIVSGSLDVVIFDDDGSVVSVIEMGDLASGRAFYYRMAEQRFHSVVIHSPHAVVHETTGGPFRTGRTTYAAWAPDESDAAAGIRYLADVVARAKVKNA